MTAVKERIGEGPAAHATADLLRRSVAYVYPHAGGVPEDRRQADPYLGGSRQDRQAVTRASALGESGSRGYGELCQSAEATPAMSSPRRQQRSVASTPPFRKIKKTELSKLARQAAELFINTQEKMVEVAGKQMNANLKITGKTLELLRPLPKTLMDAVVRPTDEHMSAAKPVRRGKKPAAHGKKAAAAAA